MALGTLHKRFETQDGLVSALHPKGYRADFACQEYCLAIRHLVRTLSSETQLTVDISLKERRRGALDLFSDCVHGNLGKVYCVYGS